MKVVLSGFTSKAVVTGMPVLGGAPSGEANLRSDE
jgi:hypothetical protein